MKQQWKSLAEMLRKRPIRKLCLIALLVFSVLAAVVFSSVYLISMMRRANLMDHHLSSFPQILEERFKELDTREYAYENDYRIRAELGAKIYEFVEESDTTVGRLEAARDAVAASWAALCDAGGKPLAVTDSEDSAILTPEAVTQLREVGVYAHFYDEETLDHAENPRFFVLQALPGREKQSLIFSFACSPMAEMEKKIGEWDDVLDRVLSGLDCTAYLRDHETGSLGRYPRTELSREDVARLSEEVSALFTDTDSFINLEIEEQEPLQLRTASLLGEKYLAVMQSFPDHGNLSIILTAKFSGCVRQAMYGVIAVLLFAALGLILFSVYAVRCMRGVPMPEGEKSRCRKARTMTLPGLAILLTATLGFLVMIMLLENKASTADIIMNQKNSLEAEIRFHESQDRLFRTEFSDMVRIRADALAYILSDRPELRTRENLQEFCRIVQADYLMLFDREGRELCASNSLTGLRVTEDEKNLRSVYYPLVIGYPNVITEPAEDPYSGKVEYSVGSLIRGEENLPDGFILVVVGAEELSSMLDSFTAEQTVDSFATLQGQVAALADTASGCFVAHTDSEMIGLPVSGVMKDSVLGSFFEGFTKYDGNNAYLSASTENGKTLMVLSQGEMSNVAGVEMLFVLVMCLAVLILFGLVYFHCAAALISEAVSGSEDGTEPEPGTMMDVFANGYGIFMCLFSVFAFLAAGHGHWPAFAFVFDSKLSRGVHLFSLWAAIFILADGFYLTALLHKLLNMLDRYTDHRTKTVMRLVDSLVGYTAVILLLFYTLQLFGVNTAAVLASAGIASIAVGMGSRDLVADLLAGVFMLLEGSLQVGDTVQIGGWEGRVTDMGIRTTRIANDRGEVKILNNSHISDVINKNCVEQS